MSQEDQQELSSRDIERLLTTLITGTPKLRAKFFANPTGQVGKQLPDKKYWPYNSNADLRRREKAELAKGILLEVAQSVKNGDLSSTVNTDSVYEDYFAPIVKVSQRSFNTMFFLCIGAFFAGLGLISSGIYIAIASSGETNSTIVGSIFGGSGAISVLGSVFAMAMSGIREATRDHAKLQIILTGFATELGQLRALAESEGGSPEVEGVTRINREIRASMRDALLDVYSSAPNVEATPEKPTDR